MFERHSSIRLLLVSRLGRLAGLLLLFAFFAPILMAGPPKFPKPHKQDGRHQIDRLEEAWRVAVLNSDTTALANLLAEDFMAITSEGTLQTKEQTLERLRSGKMRLTELLISDRKVRFYGKTAVVTSLAHLTKADPGDEPDGEFRYTRVYVRNVQGDWKIVSFEASRIRPPGQRHEHE